MNDLAEKLRALRLEHGLSQEGAARLCGVALMTWWAWEQGEREPLTESLRKVGRGFGIDWKSLVT